MPEYEYQVFMYCLPVEESEEEEPRYSWTFRLSEEDRAESCLHTGFAVPATVSITVDTNLWADMPFALRKGVGRLLSGAFHRKDVLNLTYFRWVKVDPRPGE